MMPQQYCLRWKYHHSNLQNMFSQLLDRGCFCDVTLACEGQTLKAHRVVLCACSTYFDSILTNCSVEKDPIIIMKDCKFSDVKCLIEFMYKGEINVEHNNLASLLKTAEELRIKGLAEVSWREEDNNTEQIHENKTKSNNSYKTTNNNNDHHIPNHKLINGPKVIQTSPPALVPSITVASTPSPIIGAVVTPAQPLAAAATAPQPPPPPPPLSSLSSIHNSPCIVENGSSIPIPTPVVKRKRGRPPLDSEYDSYSTPKISCINTSSSTYADNANLVSVMLGENSDEQHSKNNSNINNNNNNDNDDDDDDDEDDDDDDNNDQHPIWEESNQTANIVDQLQVDYDDELSSTRVVPKIERPDTPPIETDADIKADPDYNPESPTDEFGASASDSLTPQEQEEFKDVIKMDDYLKKGRRPQFWEEPFTRRVMETIKTKDLEMKKAAQLLGVSYGTLYGRYRETYGCLKHPYR